MKLHILYESRGFPCIYNSHWEMIWGETQQEVQEDTRGLGCGSLKKTCVYSLHNLAYCVITNSLVWLRSLSVERNYLQLLYLTYYPNLLVYDNFTKPKYSNPSKLFGFVLIDCTLTVRPIDLKLWIFVPNWVLGP